MIVKGLINNGNELQVQKVEDFFVKLRKRYVLLF